MARLLVRGEATGLVDRLQRGSDEHYSDALETSSASGCVAVAKWFVGSADRGTMITLPRPAGRCSVGRDLDATIKGKRLRLALAPSSRPHARGNRGRIFETLAHPLWPVGTLLTRPRPRRCGVIGTVRHRHQQRRRGRSSASDGPAKRATAGRDPLSHGHESEPPETARADPMSDRSGPFRPGGLPTPLGSRVRQLGGSGASSDDRTHWRSDHRLRLPNG